MWDDDGDWGGWPSGCGSAGEKSRRQFSINDDGHRRKWNLLWSSSRCTIEMKAEGQISFRPDLSGVASISSGGYLELVERIGDDLRRLRVTPGPGGRLQYAYKVNGQTRAMDAAAQRWFGEFLLALERQSAFAADQRVPHLLKKGGPSAVLDEVGRLGSDHARGKYLRKMLELARLDEPTLQRAIQIAGQRIRSDYELARVLMAIGGTYPLAGAGSRTAFLRAAGTLESDYERARVLMEILKRPNLNRDAARMALQLAVALGSDYERARVLMAISDANLLDLSMQPTYMAALTAMNSDYERARVLMDLMERQKLTAESARRAMKAVSGMKSDYEKSRVLIRLVGRGALPDDQRALFFDVVRGMNSDYERSRSLISALEKLKLKQDGVIQLIETTGVIGSDYEKARVLVALAGKMSLSGPTRSAYTRAANRIGSEYERNRALAALAN
jgi:hypothetical protein